MQDYAKQGDTFDHLSLIRNLALDIPSGVAIVKDRQNWVPFKKERFFGVLFRAPLFLGKWCGVATYFLYKKIRIKILITKYMIELFHSHQLNKIKYMLEKRKITWLWVLVTIYQKYMAFCPSYILPKIK